MSPSDPFIKKCYEYISVLSISGVRGESCVLRDSKEDVVVDMKLLKLLGVCMKS